MGTWDLSDRVNGRSLGSTVLCFGIVTYDFRFK